MGPLTSAVHWWEESQMRVLVLTSLVIQFLLFIFSFARRFDIPKFFRFIMWITYLASDAVAIYALATLFNRHKDQDRKGSSTLELEVFWAPILLIHLGGHDGITAYNIEDNELWSRHLLTAMSQVTVAIYVFCKSWPQGGDKRLLLASIVLFVPGVLKCFTKPWALKRACITSLVSSPAAKRTAKKGKSGEMDPHSLEEYVERAKAFVQEQKDEGNEAQGERACVENGNDPPPQRAQRTARLNEDEMMDPFEEYVKRARDFVIGEQTDEGGGGAQGERPPVEEEEDTKRTRWREQRERERILRGEAYKLFVDLSSLYPGRRLSIFKYFWVLSQEEQQDKVAPPDSSKEEDKADTAYSYVRRGLGSAFLLLYTKLKTSGMSRMNSDEHDFGVDHNVGHMCRVCIQMSRMVLPWAAIGLFHISHREAYNDTDAKITYAILCCTTVLEAYSYFSIFIMETDDGSIYHRHFRILISREQWPEIVPQYNLVGYLSRNKNHSKLMWVASKLGCRDLVDRNWCMESYLSSREIITELILGYLKAGWEKKIQDVASYRSFNDNRGHWALEGCNEQHLRWSIKEPFDENVLLWHIATDFCIFSSQFSDHIRVCDFAKVPSIRQGLLEHLILVLPTKTRESKKCGQRSADCKAVVCRQMSNYMLYLLFVNPEMLLPGTRRNLFMTAYDELKLKDMLIGEDKPNPQSCCCCCHCNCEKMEEKDFMKALIKKMHDKSKKQDTDNGSEEESNQEGPPNGENFIDDAWYLAQGLLKLRDDFGEEKMWEVIEGVWVEMLCFSASRCRGYLHAKALGSGGEFLSYVWLLMFYMGMETFTERLQREREEHSIREANNNAAPAPGASDSHNGNGQWHDFIAFSDPQKRRFITFPRPHRHVYIQF